MFFYITADFPKSVINKLSQLENEDELVLNLGVENTPPNFAKSLQEFTDYLEKYSPNKRSILVQDNMPEEMLCTCLENASFMSHLVDENNFFSLLKSPKILKLAIQKYPEKFISPRVWLDRNYMSLMDNETILALLQGTTLVSKLQSQEPLDVIIFEALAAKSEKIIEFLLKNHHDAFIAAVNADVIHNFSPDILSKLIEDKSFIERCLNCLPPAELLELCKRDNRYFEPLIEHSPAAMVIFVSLNWNKFDDELKQKVLSNAVLVEKLPQDIFLNLIASSDKVAEYVLGQTMLCDRLRRVEQKLYDNHLGLLPQTFTNSCTACAIVYLLKLKGDTKLDRVNEFDIYRKIWMTPGGIAEPKKIMAYLKGKGFNFVTIDLEERSAGLLEKAKGEGSSVASQTVLAGYSLFQEASKDTSVKLTKNSEIAFKPGDMTLLIVVNMLGLHTIFGMQTQDNKFQVIETGSGESTTFDCFDDFYQKTQNFSGVAFDVK